MFEELFSDSGCTPGLIAGVVSALTVAVDPKILLGSAFDA
jgi:hypothetical protein